MIKLLLFVGAILSAAQGIGAGFTVKCPTLPELKMEHRTIFIGKDADREVKMCRFGGHVTAANYGSIKFKTFENKPMSDELCDKKFPGNIALIAAEVKQKYLIDNVPQYGLYCTYQYPGSSTKYEIESDDTFKDKCTVTNEMSFECPPAVKRVIKYKQEGYSGFSDWQP